MVKTELKTVFFQIQLIKESLSSYFILLQTSKSGLLTEALLHSMKIEIEYRLNVRAIMLSETEADKRAETQQNPKAVTNLV